MGSKISQAWVWGHPEDPKGVLRPRSSILTQVGRVVKRSVLLHLKHQPVMTGVAGVGVAVQVAEVGELGVGWVLEVGPASVAVPSGPSLPCVGSFPAAWRPLEGSPCYSHPGAC